MNRAIALPLIPFALLGCGPTLAPVPCERLEVRVEIPTATPYWANIQQDGAELEWFECLADEDALASSAIPLDEQVATSRVHSCGAEGFNASLYAPGAVTVNIVYVDRYWVSRAVELEELSQETLSEDEGCPTEQPIALTIDNQVFGGNCAGGDSPESCALVGAVCGTDGAWYRSECELIDTAPFGTCPIFPGEPCQ